jgi:hypothetical protein
VSIIHEALQKTQQHLLRSRQAAADTNKKEPSRLERADILLVVVIAALLIIVIVAYYSRLAGYSAGRRESIVVFPASTTKSMAMAQPVMQAAPMQQSMQPVAYSQPMQQVAMIQPAPMMQQPQYVQYVAAPQPIQVAVPQMVQYVAAPQPMMQPMMAQPMMQQPMTTVAQPATQGMVMQQQPMMVATEADYKGKLVLNGVLLADQEKIALINNQAYHLGDSIEGMRIINIELNSITLQDGARTMVLRT